MMPCYDAVLLRSVFLVVLGAAGGMEVLRRSRIHAADGRFYRIRHVVYEAGAGVEQRSTRYSPVPELEI